MRLSRPVSLRPTAVEGESPPSSGDSIMEADDDGEYHPHPAKVVNRGRKRGRPPTTGEYIGLAAAKERLLAAKKAEAAHERGEECMRTAADLRKIGRLEKEATTDELLEKSSKAVAAVLKVAISSKNLQGRFIKVLKDAAAAISEVTEDFLARSSSPRPEGKQEKEKGEAPALTDSLLSQRSKKKGEGKKIEE